MFSSHKLKDILKRHPEDISKQVISSRSAFSMNQVQNIEVFSKNLNIPAEKSLSKPTGKAFAVQDVQFISGKAGDEEFDIPRYPGDEGNNFDSGGGKSVLRTRKANTPIENMDLNASAFSIFKPNKTYAAEIQEEEQEGTNSVDDTFHRAVGPILFLGQCFALLPVKGVLNSNPKRLQFSLKSLQMIVTAFFMCSSSVLTLTTLKHLLKEGINAKNIVGLVFFGCVQGACILFISLAPRWPKMMRYWHRIETIFTQKPYVMAKCNLAHRVRTAAVVIILLSGLEHGLYLSSAILSFKIGIQLCAPVRNVTAEPTFDDYIRRNYQYVFEILPYNMFVGLFILIVNFCCTFVWNYMDLFIMMVSKGIAYRFEQITTRINKLANKDVPETVFIEIREHYVKLCELLEYVDENLSGIILLSCINNLYFVCYQLLNIFNKLRWPINYIYFWYSLMYLIGRTAFVFLTAASINDESKGGLAVLRKVSSKTWCVEIERLIFQMTTQNVALSGKKFYYLTRRLLFGMAGTIVTYELVLLQFDEPNRAKGLPALCG